MVSTGFADVRERDIWVWLANDEDTSLLPGISLETGLLVSGARGPKGIAKTREFKGCGHPSAKPGELVGFKLGIDVHGKAQFFVFDKCFGLMGLTIADDNELSAEACDLVKFVSQLRDLLAAKKSAKMSYEDEHRVLVLPAIGERKRFAVGS